MSLIAHIKYKLKLIKLNVCSWLTGSSRLTIVITVIITMIVCEVIANYIHLVSAYEYAQSLRTELNSSSPSVLVRQVITTNTIHYIIVEQG